MLLKLEDKEIGFDENRKEEILSALSNVKRNKEVQSSQKDMGSMQDGCDG